MAGPEGVWSEKLTLAVFGIRGVGSFYYLAYGLNHMAVEEGERLWAIVGLVVLLSVLMHGLTVTPVMRLLDRSRAATRTPTHLWTPRAVRRRTSKKSPNEATDASRRHSGDHMETSPVRAWRGCARHNRKLQHQE